MHLRSLGLLCCFLLGSALAAQTCFYQLELNDSFGDGWNGAELIVRINGVATGYTVPFPDERAVFFIPVTSGDDIELDYDEGAFPGENSYRLLDNADVVLYESGPNGPSGPGVFTAIAVCNLCAAPPANTIDIRRIRATSVDIQFTSLDATSMPLYRILYAPGSFDPETDENGLEIVTTDTLLRVSNLLPDTVYTFFIGGICQSTGDSTGLRGPFVINTQKVTDVGVTRLVGPRSDCELGGEEVTIGITNFGGAPQAFFNVDFSINGVPAGVGRPEDGIFTGVVGVDSTELFTFDLRAFLNEPGEYELKLWTELEGDEVPGNDTLTVTLRSVATVNDFPYVENFEGSGGGWYTTGAGTSPSSWAWGEPAAQTIDRAPEGRRAWVTNPNGNHFNFENSSLVSPCMNFGALSEDPFFAAQLFVDTEVNFDFMVIETSTDGETWTKVTTGATTVNWYNDLENQRYEGDGGQPGFVTIATLLPDLAGQSRAQVRFRFVSDLSVVNEGILVDAVRITARADNDLAAAQVSTTNDQPCGSATDTVAFRITNLGLNTESNFEVNYQIDGGEVVTEVFTDNLFGGSSVVYLFEEPFDGSQGQEIEVRAWVSLVGDGLLTNDTTVFYRTNSLLLPFIATFEEGGLPSGWSTSANARVGDRTDGEDGSSVFANLFGFSPTMDVLTANYATVMTGDSLTFTVRQDDFGGAEPSYTDSSTVRVALITNCTDTVRLDPIGLMGDTIIRLPLDTVANNSVRVLLTFEWLTGDFWNYVDDISIFRCPADLGLTANVVDATGGGGNGVVTIIPSDGLGPYTYDWSVPVSGATAIDLEAADYAVTVTDAVGCTDLIIATVDLDTDVDEPTPALSNLRVYPNPTSALISVELTTPTATEVRLDLFDLSGRRLLFARPGRGSELRQTLDLSEYPAGTYLLRVQSDEGARTVRLVKH